MHDGRSTRLSFSGDSGCALAIGCGNRSLEQRRRGRTRKYGGVCGSLKLGVFEGFAGGRWRVLDEEVSLEVADDRVVRRGQAGMKPDPCSGTQSGCRRRRNQRCRYTSSLGTPGGRASVLRMRGCCGGERNRHNDSQRNKAGGSEAMACTGVHILKHTVNSANSAVRRRNRRRRKEKPPGGGRTALRFYCSMHGCAQERTAAVRSG